MICPELRLREPGRGALLQRVRWRTGDSLPRMRGGQRSGLAVLRRVRRDARRRAGAGVTARCRSGTGARAPDSFASGRYQVKRLARRGRQEARLPGPRRAARPRRAPSRSSRPRASTRPAASACAARPRPWGGSATTRTSSPSSTSARTSGQLYIVSQYMARGRPGGSARGGRGPQAPARRGAAHRRGALPRPRARPRARRRAPRPQARQRLAHRRRQRPARRLRPGPLARPLAAHAARHDGGHGRLHAAGAGPRAEVGRALRPLRAGRDALRDGDGPPALSRATTRWR